MTRAVLSIDRKGRLARGAVARAPTSPRPSRPTSKAGPLSPEVLERRRAQLRVARRMLDRPMAERVLNAAGVVASIGQRVAARMAQQSSSATQRATEN